MGPPSPPGRERLLLRQDKENCSTQGPWTLRDHLNSFSFPEKGKWGAP